MWRRAQAVVDGPEWQNYAADDPLLARAGVPVVITYCSRPIPWRPARPSLRCVAGLVRTRSGCAARSTPRWPSLPRYLLAHGQLAKVCM
jgi:hypothetical protein